MLECMAAVIGPPAAGKTSLTVRLAGTPGCAVFRLREHVPHTVLATAAANTDRVDWVDDLAVARALRSYTEAIVLEGATRVVLLDNFPGSGTQVRLLSGIVRRLAPACIVHAVELLADRSLRARRIRGRRVCHQCEQDPISDPRIPAVASQDDPKRCARCGGVLHPRRGDAPRLVTARTRRYEAEIPGVRSAFAEAGVQVVQLDSNRPLDALAADLSALVAVERRP
jgi:adenylate kinase